MNSKPIQTPLISGKFYKDIPLKRFIVSSDSLAPIMWRGYDLHCLPIPQNTLPEPGTFVVIECRVVGRKYITYRIGYFDGVTNQRLALHLDDEDLKEPIGDWSVPINQVKRIWEIDKIVKWYDHMRKFFSLFPHH
ncbi:hypothetical protein GCM10028808_60610 [Spirosoma migulaei]